MLVNRINRAFAFMVFHLALLLSLQTARADEWLSPLLQEHVLVGSIFSTASGRVVSEDELLGKLKSARFVLLGEKHDNPDHHQLEERLLTELISKDSGKRVVFEMLDDSQQDLLGGLSVEDSLADLKQKLQWPERGWDWESYGPLFKLVLERGGKVVAGNVSTKILKQVYQTGISGSASDDRFQSMTVLSAQEQAEIQQQIYKSHCEMMPFEKLAPMVATQVSKDASMAYALSQGNSTSAILVAGGFHASKTLGVPRHLQQLAPAAKTLVVMLYEVEEGLSQLEDYLEETPGIADYIWFTPKATDKDYCAAFKNHKSVNKQ